MNAPSDGHTLVRGASGRAMRYESLCDPRLNHMQSPELAFLVAEELEQR